jgi:diguanylate cyclase (GGDEF)-like protein/PAS domain S-box-containing protein
LDDPKRNRQETFGSSYPPKADPDVLARFPSRRPSEPSLVPMYEQGQLQLLRMLFEHVPDGVVGTDPVGFITEANPAAHEIFGRSAEELEGQPVFEYLVDEYGTPLTQVIGREIDRFRVIRNRHVYVVRPDGSRRSCTLCAGPLVHDGNILRAFGIFRDRTELEELVQIDSLTGLLNERTFYERAEEHIRMSRRKGESLAVAYIDLRKFKEVNDRCRDHAEGDRVLMKLGARLKKALFDTDFCARLHGDEFAVLLTRISRENIDKAARKIVEAISFEIDLVAKESGDLETVSISGDIGICWRENGDIPDAKTLMRLADEQMFLCKEAVKRGDTCLYRANDQT